MLITLGGEQVLRFACVSLAALAAGLVGEAAFGQQSAETYTYDVLGRLVVADTSGGDKDGEAHSICYDSGDNRSQYRTAGNHTVHSCVDAGQVASAPTPTPTPTPEPTNSPPVAMNDSATVNCNVSATINVTANDSDPDGHVPLAVAAMIKTSGSATSWSIVSGSSVSVTPSTSGTKIFTYTVEDTLGASAQGTLTVSVPVAGCTQ